MARILGLDLGERRTGVALTDPAGMIALPRAVLLGDPVPQVAELVRAEGVERVVVGDPLSLSGGETAQTRAARATVERLRAALSVPVEMIDERLTSVEASRARRDAGLRGGGSVDAEAAALLLAAYLARK